MTGIPSTSATSHAEAVTTGNHQTSERPEADEPRESRGHDADAVANDRAVGGREMEGRDTRLDEGELDNLVDEKELDNLMADIGKLIGLASCLIAGIG